MDCVSDDVHNMEDSGLFRVLIVSEHASTRFGGEAILPWHYFHILRRRGILRREFGSTAGGGLRANLTDF